MEESYSNIRKAIDQLLNVKSSVKRKKQTKQVQHRDLFVNIINTLQMMIGRSTLAFTDLKVDLSSYEEPYLEVIEALLLMRFGKESFELIAFYLWERESPDGSINDLLDESDNIVPLENAIDLWNLIIKLNPNLDK